MEKNQQKSPIADDVTKATEVPELDAHTRKLVEKTIARVNGLMAEAHEKYDDVADHLFETYYDGDVQRALTPLREMPAGIAALAKEADGALHLGRTMLFHAVRIGALNRRLVRTVWKNLGWTAKTELLPLLGADLSYERMTEGAVHVWKTKATVREVREYVAQRLTAAAEGDTGEGGRLGPSFQSGRKALSVTAGLGKAVDRRRWVDRYLKLGAEARGEFLSAVKASARNLEKLAQELASAVDDG